MEHKGFQRVLFIKMKPKESGKGEAPVVLFLLLLQSVLQYWQHGNLFLRLIVVFIVVVVPSEATLFILASFNKVQIGGYFSPQIQVIFFQICSAVDEMSHSGIGV